MLKYHNYDNEDLPLEIYVNGSKLDIEDKVGREVITAMRNTYFALFDLVSVTDVDIIKKKLMKNKLKSISIEIWALMMKEHSKDKTNKAFSGALSASGIVVTHLEPFVNFAFSDTKNRDYFLSESIKVFNDKIYTLSILQ